MDKCEREHQALEQIKGWLSTFPNDKEYPFSWVQHKEMLFDIFKDTYPGLSAGRIRDHLNETWREGYPEKAWQTIEKILAAWEEWMYAWNKYPQPHQDQGIGTGEVA
jgi:hypothetical protein